jgi:hypothetical protein
MPLGVPATVDLSRPTITLKALVYARQRFQLALESIRSAPGLDLSVDTRTNDVSLAMQYNPSRDELIPRHTFLLL